MTDPLSITAGIIAILQLSSQVVSYVKSAKGATEDRNILRYELRQCESLLTKLKDEIEDAEARSTWAETVRALEGEGGPLQQLSLALKVMKAKLAPQVGIKKAIATIKWPFHKTEVASIIATVERQRKLLEFAQVDDCRKLIQEVKKSSDESRGLLKDLNDILSHVQHSQSLVQSHHLEEEALKIISWLSSLDYRATHEQNLRSRQEGTNKWVLDNPEFKDWIQGNTKILWGYGSPGAGKSILASSVISHIKSGQETPRAGLGVILFDYKLRNTISGDDVLLSITQQLLAQHYAEHRTLPKCLVELYNSAHTNLSFENLLQFPTIIEAVACLHKTVFIVLDALDECKEDFQDIVIQRLRAFPILDLRIFCTSRPLPRIRTIFKDQISIEITARNEDIETFVKGQIASRVRLKDQVKRDPALERLIVSDVTSKTCGMFLLAKFHMDSLASKTTPAGIREALRDLPTTLQLTYEKSMDRIESHDVDKELAFSVLLWVTFAFRPLNVEEMRHAIASYRSLSELVCEDDLTDVETMLHVCDGLVKLVPDSRSPPDYHFEFVHYTMQEFFRRRLTTIVPNGQAILAQTCINYLSLDCFNATCPTYEDLQARVSPKGTSPLYGYAAQNWGHHSCAASEDLEKPVLEFLGSEKNFCASTQALMAVPTKFSDYLYTQPSKFAPLHVTTYFGLSKILETLINGGHDTSTRDVLGRTPLWWAAEHGQEDITKILLEFGQMHKDSKDRRGETPLLRAVHNGYTGIVKLLIAADPRVDCADDMEGYTPLSVAAQTGNKELVQLLLAAGASVDFKTGIEQTALSCAAERGYGEIVNLLLENGGDVNSRDEEGRTALWWATENRHESVVEQLLAAGSKPNIADYEWNHTPLLWAAGRGSHGVARHLLASDQVNKNCKDYLGRTPLSRAAENGQTEMVKLLLAETDVLVNSIDSWGRTPLWWAEEHEHIEVAGLLRAAGGIKSDGLL